MRVSNNTEWLFFHLWKKNPDTLLPCLNLYLAETIIYRWAQPYFWYYTAKDGMIVRKTKEKISLQAIEDSYMTDIAKCNVAVSTMTSSEDPLMKSQETIEFEYITKPEFHDFLFQREKSHNILIQKFIEPKNGQNALIKVAWTPQFCLFFRKTNVNDINSQKVPLNNRLATFEGGEHLSNSDSISSPILASELEQTCLNIVNHIHSVTGGNIQVSKMVLYFKLDEKNRLWLLFCTGLKLREKGSNPHTVLPFKKKKERPLSPIMTITEKKEKAGLKPSIPVQYMLEDQLNEVDNNCCLRCNKEDLLYDLKLKHVLGFEEKALKEAGPPEVKEKPQEETKPEKIPGYFESLLIEQELKSRNVPAIMKKLYPNITEERYLKLKRNMSLINMPIKLCENCYLMVTEQMLANPEEEKAKKRQVTLKKISKKEKDSFGFASLSEPQKHSAFKKTIKTTYNPSSSDPEGTDQDPDTNNESPFNLKSSVKYNLLKNNSGSISPIKSSQPPSSTSNMKNNNERSVRIGETKRDKLPQISVFDEGKAKPKNVLVPIAKTSSQGGLGTQREEKPLISGKGRSPYAIDVTLNTSNRTHSFPLLINSPVTARPMAFDLATRNQSTRHASTSSFSKNSLTSPAYRTNYNSMLSTIQDLKNVLGKNINDL